MRTCRAAVHRAAALASLAGALLGANCGAPGSIRGPAQIALQLGPGETLRGATGDGSCIAVVRSTASNSVLELRRATTRSAQRPPGEWHIDLPGIAGPIALTPTAVVVALSGQKTWAVPPGKSLEIRGEPGAALVAVDVRTGQPTWRLGFDATEWALISSLAWGGSDLIVVGAFSGTLRVGPTVVSSAGKSDGFIAKLHPGGALVWLRRLGGPDDDSVSAVAAGSGSVAIAGTAGADAELGGVPIASPNGPRSSSGFVAVVDAAGAPAWSHSFGGRYETTVAGVAIDSGLRVAVGATIRSSVRIGTRDIATNRPSAGLVLQFSPAGQLGPATVIESSATVALRSLVAVGDRVIVGGAFTGTLANKRPSLTASADGGVFLAGVDRTGAISSPWNLASSGRQELVSLVSVSGGFLAGVSQPKSALLISER